MAVAQPVPAADPAAAAAARREIKIVLPGLLLAILLAMLDQLIVGTALPRIVGDLGGVAHLSWVVTAYVLASTVTTPLYGKLGDLYGRKKLFLTAIVIFLAGSALSGLAQSMTQLIGFRALQGLGAGGLMVGAISILGELVSPRERGKYMGYIMAVMMVATIGGPLAGGFITDNLSWRWVFYINLPIGGVAFVYLARVLKLPATRTEHKIDYLGAGLLALAATSIVLVSTWGGTEFAWGSGRILGLSALALAATAAFLLVEARAAEPILPLRLFRNRNFSLVAGLSFLVGLAMFGAITFLPLYQQTVQGASPTVSGLLLTPMMVGVMVTSIIAGQITSRTGRYKALPILGSVGMGAGMYLLSMLGVHTTKVTSGLYFVVLGLGMGLLMQITSLMAQNSVELKDIGVASSSASSTRRPWPGCRSWCATTCSSPSRTRSTASSSGRSRRWCSPSWSPCSSGRSRCAATSRPRAKLLPPRPNSSANAGSDPAVRDRLEDLDGRRAPVWQVIGRRFPDLLAGDRVAQRGPRRVDVDRRAALLAGREQECHLVLVTLEPDGHRHAGTDYAIRARRVPDAGVVQDVLQLVDAALLLALFLLGRVIATVLLQVALVPGGLDLLGDLDAAWPG